MSAEPTGEHRTTSRYVRCTCEYCRRMRRRQQKLRLLGKGGMVPVDQVADLFDRLMAQGMSTYDIAAAAGIDQSKVTKYRRRKVKTMRWAVANRILSGDYSQHLPGTRVPGLGTQRRLQALCALGWPTKVQAERTGLPASTLTTLTSGNYKGASHRVAKAVSDLYDQLSGTIGPSEMSRTRARNKGWHPPLAWNDIDDPKEKPRR